MSLIAQCFTPWAMVANQFIEHQCHDIYAMIVSDVQFSLVEYLTVFSKTYGLELIIYFFFLRQKYNWREILKINLIINLATHPIVYFGFPLLFSKLQYNYFQYLVVAEIFAPAIEALLLKKIYHFSWKIAITAAVLANLFSWTIGVYWR